MFLVAHAEETHSRLTFDLGTIPGLERFTACHRYEPFWMKSVCGERLQQVPSETQWLLARRRDGPANVGARWLMIVPLFGEACRFSLRAAVGGTVLGQQRLDALELLGETGDPLSAAHGGLCAYVATGPDPFELCNQGARSVANRLGTGRLRRDKEIPDFCDELGWCTWDAFYTEVNPSKVLEGLASFRHGGVEPRWLILDDGWQSEKRMDTGERRLTSFAANEKFPENLAPLVHAAKNDFAIHRFLVWHTITGYWGGVDGASFPEFRVQDQARRFGEGILEHRPSFDEQWWGALVGLPHKEQAGAFFDAYHASLRQQGVDGVKVDGQSVLEGIACGQGGRVSLTLAYRTALEESARRHFDGRLLNCMSNGQESWYAGRDSTLLRSSIDFFPSLEDAHGAHLHTNAQVAMWFGHFMLPDWDMFQSGHARGSFHAAARAVSGGPVYLSDKPGTHDVALIRKLTCSDGTVLRCDEPGVPTLGCLCRDPTTEPVLLQIKNRNGNASVLGVFNCLPRSLGQTVGNRLEFDDVLRHGNATEFACYAHTTDSLERLRCGDERWCTLGPAAWELFTVVPLENDFAAIGLADKLNSRGAVRTYVDEGTRMTIALRDGGRFVAYSNRRVAGAECSGESLAFEHDGVRLDVRVPEGGARDLTIRFA